jgi:glycosyltransferase involved in cell wall biosynthesis
MLPADLVTVYVPTKNRVDLLRRAVQSVLAQTVRNLELVIVSDGSTDATCDYVHSIRSDIVVRLLHQSTSRGACAARNDAIAAARGRFITGLDDDDMFLPTRIAAFLQAWERQSATGQRFACLFDRRIVLQRHESWLANCCATVDETAILRANLIGNQVFTLTQSLRQIGGFDADMPAWQDWELWVRLLRQFGPARNIAANTYVLDIGHDSDRISAKGTSTLLDAAGRFHRKHGGAGIASILRSLGDYQQVRFTPRDLLLLLQARELRFVLAQLRRGRLRLSTRRSVPALDAGATP